MSFKRISFNEKTAMRIVNGAQEGFIRTRDHRPVRLLCNDARGEYPIVGLIEMEMGDMVSTWTRSGKHDARRRDRDCADLILFVEEGGEK